MKEINKTCYYHNGISSTQLCSYCKRYICDECATQGYDGKILCKRCATFKLQGKERKTLWEIILFYDEYIKYGIVGTIICVLLAWMLSKPYFSGIVHNAGELCLFLYFAFSWSYSFFALKEKLDLWFVRYFVSGMFGMLIFPVYLVTFVTKVVKAYKQR